MMQSPLRSIALLSLAAITLAACGGADDSASDESVTPSGVTKTGNKGGSTGKGGSSAGGSTSSTGGSTSGAGATTGSGGKAAGGSTGSGTGGASNTGGTGSGKGGAGGMTSGGGSTGTAGKAGASGGSGTGKVCSATAECDDKNECTDDSCLGGKCDNAPKKFTTCAGGTKVCNAGVCSLNVCGDGVKMDSEECDDGNAIDTDACRINCTLPKCGDGVPSVGEECDDGNTNDFDGCTSQCKKPGSGSGQGFDPMGEGSSGVKLDPFGNIIIDPEGAITKQTKPYIWIANSGEGTISKINTQTLVEEARYCTAPGCNKDPSRTTVGLSADAVVANRAGTVNYHSSAIRIAADEANCIDRNGNGVIDTFKGSGNVPPQFMWPEGQTTSPDECVLWFSDFGQFGDQTGARAAGFDAEIGEKGELSVFVYIGLYFVGKLLRINAADGSIVKAIDVPGNPYGLVLDKDGAVWIQSGQLVKVDVKNNDAVSTHSAQCMYGIAADPQGRIYTSGYGDQCLRRYDPSTGTDEVIGLEGWGGGVAVDQNNHVWTGQTGRRVDASGPQMFIVGRSSVGGHGWAIDYDNKPWAIPLAGSYTAYKLDPNSDPNNLSYQQATPGQGHYTYSDMTGFQLINAASKSGIFRRTFKGCGSTTQWGDLDFTITSPAGTNTTIRVRVGNSQAELSAAPWQEVASIPPSMAPIPINMTGDLIQVEVAMKSKDLTVTPILSTLSVSTKNCSKE